jgi:4-hydroxy-tetrahydrodipicolinate synthase
VTSARSALADVSVVLVTPFSEDDSIDASAFSDITAAAVRAGVGSVVTASSVGEFYSLNRIEWTHLLRSAIEVVGSSTTAVFAGVGHDLASAVEMSREAEDLGGAAVMVHPPPHAYVTPEGHEAYLGAISRAVSIGVIPYVRSPLPADVLTRLCALENVIGMKFAIADPVTLGVWHQVVQDVDGDFVFSCGLAERWAPAMWASGATGFTSGIANLAPEVAVRFLGDLGSGDATRIRDTWSRIEPLERLRNRDGGGQSVAVVKAACAVRGMSVGTAVRPPASAIETSEMPDIEAAVSALGGAVRGFTEHSVA